MTPALCTWYPASTLIFSSNVYAPLIYYSHVTSFIVALIIGFLILWSNPRALANRVLFAMTVFFSAWVFFDMVIWASEKPSFVMFFWASIVPIELSIYATGLYLVSIFANHGHDVSLKKKLIIAAFFIPIFLLAHTSYNLLGFDYSNCDRNAIEGPLIQYMYIIELFFIGWAASIASRAYRKITDVKERQQMFLVSLGTILMLMLFTSGNLIVTYFLSVDWSYDQYKLMGMPLFVAFIAYSMVKFKTFNSKLIAAQALVAGIAISVLSLLFIREIIHVRVIAGIIFVLICILGYRLTRSVQREMEQSEKLSIANKALEIANKNLEISNKKLQTANEMQADTTSLITHQIRGVFATAKAGLSNLIDGTYGPVPQTFVEVLDSMFKSQVAGVKTVETFLQAQKIESGTIQYEKKPFDLKAIVEDRFAQEKPRTETKGLQYELQIDAGDYMITGDQVYLTQVIANLIDNAIRYTEKGSIEVHLSKKGGDVLYSVKDSGIGIPDGDKEKMFTKYGHGKDSRKINAETAGLGLYIVKGIVDGHGGKIWYQTEVGKGTTFFVELPITQSDTSGQTVAS